MWATHNDNDVDECSMTKFIRILHNLTLWHNDGGDDDDNDDIDDDNNDDDV